MLHLFYFITRKDGMAETDFHHYWRDTHGPLLSNIPQLTAYIQSHAVSGSQINTAYDGAAEAWVADFRTLTALRESNLYRDGSLADQPNFIDMNRIEWLVTRDRVVIDGPQNEGMVKTISFLKRKRGMSVEAFREHWLHSHGPIAKTLPGIRRYVQCLTVEEAYEFATPQWDGISEIWVDNHEALVALRESKQYTEDAMADAAEFLELSGLAVFAAEEAQVIWPQRE